MIATVVALLFAVGCATTGASGYGMGPSNTCDVSEYASGYPECLPMAGFFCVDPPEEGRHALMSPSRQYMGQLFPSRYSVGPNQPICPPNATRLVQEQDRKDAKRGAKAIGREVGRVLTICEQKLEWMTKQPEHTLADWNQTQPEELEAALTVCASQLDSLPAIPEFEEPSLANEAAEGFKEGYGDGVAEIMNRLLLMELALAAVEVGLTAGVGLADVALTRGLRVSLSAARRMPIFLPGAVSGAGAFLKNAPRVVANVAVEGSARILGRNLKLAGLTRLPGEFAHHIVAHGDHRAKATLEVLKRFGIKVDSAVNGVYLPGYKTSPNPLGKVVHGNLHTDAYYQAVHKLLKDVPTKDQAIEVLRAIAWKLEHGLMP